jgi:DNA-binding SARP family transcriptional activator
MVMVAEGRFQEAIKRLEEAVADPDLLGVGVNTVMDATLAEALYLAGALPERIADVARRIEERPTDPRDAAVSSVARAIAIHTGSACRGECVSPDGGLSAAAGSGAFGTSVISEVKIGVLRLSHGRRREIRRAWTAARTAMEAGLGIRLRPWLRLYSDHAASALTMTDGANLLTRLTASDPEGWRLGLVAALPEAAGADRQALLRTISRHADRQTIEAMRGLDGKDIADARRSLQDATAARLFLRTFGGVSLHRGDWAGPALPIDKKRVRLLLALLAARSDTALTRDAAVDTLWPDAEPEAAINNLNQTVFQLRRYIDPDYKAGESPEYVISSSEHIGLNRRLVRTDVDEIRALPGKIGDADWTRRNATAARVVGLVRGEFLADLPYEQWTGVQQMAVHGEVRSRLLPIAADRGAYAIDVSIGAASALLALDPYDETVVLALADSLTRSGRRVAARNLVVDYARRVHAELDERPSEAVATAIDNLRQPKHDQSPFDSVAEMAR